MRQGAMVAHRKTSETSAEELAELMVGRPVAKEVARQPANVGPTRLSATRLELQRQQRHHAIRQRITRTQSR